MAEISEPATAVALLFGKATLEQVYKKINTGIGGDIAYLEKWWKSKDWQDKLKGSKISGLPAGDRLRLLPKTGLDKIKAAKSSGNEKKIKDATSAYYKTMENVSVGVSAGIAIYKWMKLTHGRNEWGGTKSIDKIFITGSKWDSEIQKFQVPHAGMKDFNSSDIVIRTSKYTYFGVSLKKKTTPTAGDPTLINRNINNALLQVNKDTTDALDRTIQDPKKKTGKIKVVAKNKTTIAATKFLSDLENERWNYFGSIVKDKDFRKLVLKSEGVYVPKKIGSGTDAVKDLVKYKWTTETVKKHTDRFLGITSSERKKEPTIKQTYINVYPKFAGKKTDTNAKKKALINFKGKGDEVRKFVNTKVASPNNKYFQYLGKLLGKTNTTTNEMANELTDHVLKLSLGRALSDNDALSDYHFGFCLATGISKTEAPTSLSPSLQKKFKKGRVGVSPGKAIDQASIVCILSKYFGAGSEKEDYFFKVIPNKVGSSAASINIEMWKKVKIKGTGVESRYILWMQLRYKGDFLNPPDFQAKLSPPFTKLLTEACDPAEPH